MEAIGLTTKLNQEEKIILYDLHNTMAQEEIKWK